MRWSLFGAEVTFDGTQDVMTWLLALIAVATATARFLIRPVIQFGRRLERVMTSVESQLYPNGGTTLRDAVTSIQRELGIEVTTPDHDPNHSKETP